MNKLRLLYFTFEMMIGNLKPNKRQRKNIGVFVALIIFIILGHYFSVWFTVFGILSHFISTHYLLKENESNAIFSQFDKLFGN